MLDSISISRAFCRYGWLVTLLIAATGCEENPVGGGDRIGLTNRVLSGQVELDRNVSPENVFIWLESFDISTRTDADGRFQLTLPPAGAQSTGGISGAFTLYAFMGNYTLGTTEVFTRNGEFIFDTPEVSDEGALRQPELLFQRLNIKTTVEPTSVEKETIVVTRGKSNFFMDIDVSLQAVKDDTVLVFFPAETNSVHGPLLFRNTETNEVTVLSSFIAEEVTSELDTVTAELKTRSMEINLLPDDLKVGEYEIVPYLLVNDITLPQGLQDEFGLAVLSPGEIYLRIPFVRNGNQRFFRVE